MTRCKRRRVVSAQKTGRRGGVQHRGVRAVEPGLDDILFFAEIRTHLIERDPSRVGHLMQAHHFPRARLG